MKTSFSPKNNPRVIIIQKLYGKFYNDDEQLTYPCLLYTLRAHETGRNLVCRLLLEKKKTTKKQKIKYNNHLSHNYYL